MNIIPNDIVWSRVLTVDPGVIGTGYALWPAIASKCSPDTMCIPTLTGVIKPKVSGEWIKRANDVTRQFNVIVCASHPKTIIIEVPQVWSTSAKSMASATKGDIISLAMLIGMLSDVARTNEMNVIHISPSEWKGQLSKKAVEMRIARAMPTAQHFRDHELDAIGMGLSMQGVL